MTDRIQTEGFTLIEALVAMAVLAVGAVTMLTAVENHARRLAGLSDRVVARWVAEDRLARAALGVPVTDADNRMMDHDWTVNVARATTSDPELARIDIQVAADRDTDALVTLTGFVDTTKGSN